MAVLRRPQAPPPGTTWLPTVIVLVLVALTLLAVAWWLGHSTLRGPLSPGAGSSVSQAPGP